MKCYLLLVCDVRRKFGSRDILFFIIMNTASADVCKNKLFKQDVIISNI